MAYSSDLDTYKSAGTSSLEGQAFLRQNGGGVVTCAGEAVKLIPYAGLFKEAYDLSKSGKAPLPNGRNNITVVQYAEADPTYEKLIKSTKCDAQGNFKFEGLPSGEWVALTKVQWIVADLPQGAKIGSRVSLNVGETKRVLLSDSDGLL
jgi:hypothetical protein